MQSLKSLIKSILPKPESSSLAMILYKGYGFISRKKMTKAELENDRATMQSLKSLIKSILPKPESSSLAMILYKGYGFISRKKMTKAELENDRASYIAQNTDTRFAISREFDYICRADKYANNGAGIESNSDYFIQDIWGARKVTATKPARHYDVGSSVAGFIAHLLGANQPTTLIDIRPLPSLNTSFLNLNGGGATISAS